jgi:uncharacterized membrane protein
MSWTKTIGMVLIVVILMSGLAAADDATAIGTVEMKISERS